MSNLYNKYVVTKADGSPVDPEAQYFVLRIDTDEAARYAVLQYASYIGASDPEFADELRNWVMQRHKRNLTKDAVDSDTDAHLYDFSKQIHEYSERVLPNRRR